MVVSIFAGVALLAISAGAEVSAVGTSARYVVREVANPAYRPSQIFSKFEDISAPGFEEIRRRYPLSDVVKPFDDEMERILALRNWVYKRLVVDRSKPLPGRDALTLLEAGPSGGPFDCEHSMIVQNAIMNAMGYVTRCLQPGPGGEENTYEAAGNHGVNEIWSNKHGKWFLSDAEFDGHFEKDGVPLSALEIRDEWLKDKAANVKPVQGPLRTPVQPQDLFSPHTYTWIGYELAGNRHSIDGFFSSVLVVYDDEYFRTHTWYRWRAPRGGKARPHWAYNGGFFLPVKKREWIEWTPNVVSVRATIEGMTAKVSLSSCTPNFKEYQAREPGDAWAKVEAQTDVALSGARVEREFRAVNYAGVAGPVSRLLVERE